MNKKLMIFSNMTIFFDQINTAVVNFKKKNLYILLFQCMFYGGMRAQTSEQRHGIHLMKTPEW